MTKISEEIETSFSRKIEANLSYYIFHKKIIKFMEKVVTKIFQKHQKSDFNYWQKQPYIKRLEALYQVK